MDFSLGERPLRPTRRQLRRWVVVLLPGLLLRALIPIGFMPMFGPGLSASLMLCPAYAPVSGSQTATADAAMDMSGMDMSTDTSTSATRASGSANGGSSEHPDHTLCPYAASAALGAPPVLFTGLAGGPSTAGSPQFVPQVGYFQLSPRAQSARGPPVIQG